MKANKSTNSTGYSQFPLSRARDLLLDRTSTWAKHKTQQDAVIRAAQPHPRSRPRFAAMLQQQEQLGQESASATQPQRDHAPVFTPITVKICHQPPVTPGHALVWKVVILPWPLRTPSCFSRAPLCPAGPSAPGQGLPRLVASPQVCRGPCSHGSRPSLAPALAPHTFSTGTACRSFTSRACTSSDVPEAP